MITFEGPEPTDAEAAAIMAATQALWPRPVVLVDDAPTRRGSAWRFSGRWWSLPIPVRRDRPWT
jgi:hypothetical protein